MGNAFHPGKAVSHHSSAVRLSQSREQHQEMHGSSGCGHTNTSPSTHPFCHLAGYNPSAQLFLIRYHKPAHGKSLLRAWGASSHKYQLLLTPTSRQGGIDRAGRWNYNPSKTNMKTSAAVMGTNSSAREPHGFLTSLNHTHVEHLQMPDYLIHQFAFAQCVRFSSLLH